MEEEEKIFIGYNRACNDFFCRERNRKNITRKQIAKGLFSQNSLAQMEEGSVVWKKMTGDILFQRLGIDTNYVESLASLQELQRWRMREDVVVLILEHPRQAEEKLEEYKKNYRNREGIEEQFLLKMEIILNILDWRSGTNSVEYTRGILKKSEQLVSNIIEGDWKRELSHCPLAPADLEGVLLVAIAQYINQNSKQAWHLQQKVWQYPAQKHWNDRMKSLIWPQAALIGIKML